MVVMFGYPVEAGLERTWRARFTSFALRAGTGA